MADAARAVLIVGGSGAIGAAVARRFDRDGWRCLTASRSPDADLHLDLRDDASIESLATACPPLDALVVAAGSKPARALRAQDREYVTEMVQLHVVGPMLVVRALVGQLTEGSAIVLLGSTAANIGSYDPAYAAAKGAVASLARTLARELAPRTRVNALAPGLVEGTPVERGMSDDFRDRHVQQTPLERLLPVDECADAIHFLCTQPHATGVVLHLNGGRHFA